MATGNVAFLNLLNTKLRPVQVPDIPNAKMPKTGHALGTGAS